LSRNTRGHKELDQLQTIKRENDKLKKQISSLRKQLARLDLDRHSYVKDIIDEHYASEEHESSTKEMLKSLKNEWACDSCGIGFLEINIYNRPDGAFYYRHCNNCIKRTKAQKYDPDKVRGIVKVTSEEDK
jgi:hypothetical protein